MDITDNNTLPDTFCSVSGRVFCCVGDGSGIDDLGVIVIQVIALRVIFLCVVVSWTSARRLAYRRWVFRECLCI